jgi:DNA-binding PadR family transcriptional regulator
MLSEVELTILGLTANGPRYGYEIEQQIDAQGLRDWLHVGFSSVYSVLNRLQRQTLVRSHEAGSDAIGNPARNIYQITEAGQGVLQTALVEHLRRSHVVGTNFELGLANLDLLRPQQVYEALLYRRAALTEHLAAATATWDDNRENGSIAQSALFTHAIAIMQAELDWLANFLAEWKGLHPHVETGRIPRVVAEDDPRATQPHIATRLKSAKHVQILKRPHSD